MKTFDEAVDKIHPSDMDSDAWVKYFNTHYDRHDDINACEKLNTEMVKYAANVLDAHGCCYTHLLQAMARMALFSVEIGIAIGMEMEKP